MFTVRRRDHKPAMCILQASVFNRRVGKEKALFAAIEFAVWGPQLPHLFPKSRHLAMSFAVYSLLAHVYRSPSHSQPLHRSVDLYALIYTVFYRTMIADPWAPPQRPDEDAQLVADAIATLSDEEKVELQGFFTRFNEFIRCEAGRAGSPHVMTMA